MPRHVVVWGRRPPPIGGVAVSFARYADTCLPRGIRAVDLNGGWRSRLCLAASVVWPTIHVISASRAVRLAQAARLAQIPGQIVIPYLRGGGLIEELPVYARRRQVFTRMPRVWVTNDTLGQVALETGATSYSVVSPFLSTDIAGPVSENPASSSRGCLTLITACYEGRSIYGVAECLDAAGHLRDTTGLEHQLIVVHYGAWTQDRERLVKELDLYPWVRQLHDVPPREMDRILSKSDVLLRLTSTDGDSNLVRQALASRLRVVASECVPRPAGVEVCGTSAEDVADAIVLGGKVVTAAQPSTPFDIAVEGLLRAEAPEGEGDG